MSVRKQSSRGPASSKPFESFTKTKTDPQCNAQSFYSDSFAADLLRRVVALVLVKSLVSSEHLPFAYFLSCTTRISSRAVCSTV